MLVTANFGNAPMVLHFLTIAHRGLSITLKMAVRHSIHTKYSGDFKPSSECDYANFVTACGGTPVDPTTAIPPPTINAPPFDCNSKADGLHAFESCSSSYFYSCNGGIATAMQCTPGLVFDAVNNQCNYQEGCGQTT
jgi:hypothetical protein